MLKTLDPRPLVYVSSPYTKGDPAINVRFQCEIFDMLLSDKVVLPIVPLWSHFQHIVFPRPYEDWLKYDLAIIPRCDAVLRLNSAFVDENIHYYQSESSGADREIELALEKSIPVFYSVETLYDWVASINSVEESSESRME